MGLRGRWALRCDLSIRTHQEDTVPRRKPKPRELTDEQMLRQLFPKEAREEARKTARQAAEKEERKDIGGQFK